ncbi:unnamed protein product [Hymenolepis diminuta]|uniref:Sm domain-containing protein n=1 Tax=Hymenolepis diminuta TaxID=6216 RepID=A0A0R3ST05_HYMDI|nr:unnamed protein product [Hymenolepis diminuta]
MAPRNVITTSMIEESTLAPISPSSPQVTDAYGDDVQLYGSMRYEAKFLEKMIIKGCYVTDRNINLVSLDWIDDLNPIQFPDENETSRTSILEHSKAPMTHF